MLIRSTPEVCVVMLNNGLTLEVFYDAQLTGAPPADVAQAKPANSNASQGVWLMGETVVAEVRAGQA